MKTRTTLQVVQEIVRTPGKPRSADWKLTRVNDQLCCNLWQRIWTVITMALKGKIRALHQREGKSISETKGP